MEEKGKEWTKKEKERNLKVARWIILNNYCPGKKKKTRKNQKTVFYISLFFRATYIFTKLVFLYWVTYFTVFMVVSFLQQTIFKKAIMFFFSVERTHKKSYSEYFFLLTCLLNLSWGWARFYTESCAFQHVRSFVFGWKRGHELENSMRRDWRPQVAFLLVMYWKICI